MIRGRKLNKDLKICGVGVASPIGISPGDLGQALQEGRSGVRHHPYFQNREKPLAVGLSPVDDIIKMLSAKGIAASEEDGRAFCLAAYALMQALESGLPIKNRMGLFVGSSLTTSELVSNAYETYFIDNRCSVKTIFDCMSAMLCSKLAESQSLSSTCLNISNSCASSTMAIRAARGELLLSEVEQAVVVGVDSCFTQPFLDTWCASRVLSRPVEASNAARPFCATRRGFVFAEAAAALRVCLATEPAPFTVVGIGHSFRGKPFHELSADGMAESMKNALDDAEIFPEDVTFVHAAANGSLQGDFAEAEAIHRVFGSKTPVYASKALTGNTFGASGTVGIVACMEICEAGRLPRNPNVQETDEKISALVNCYNNDITLCHRGYALINSFGFGGHYASLVLGFHMGLQNEKGRNV
jgi:3-oxoacyl-[acyl-carrier-protein] synthase II